MAPIPLSGRKSDLSPSTDLVRVSSFRFSRREFTGFSNSSETGVPLFAASRWIAVAGFLHRTIDESNHRIEKSDLTVRCGWVFLTLLEKSFTDAGRPQQ